MRRMPLQQNWMWKLSARKTGQRRLNMRYYEFTEAGKWFVRSENGQFVSHYYDGFEQLLSALDEDEEIQYVPCGGTSGSKD